MAGTLWSGTNCGGAPGLAKLDEDGMDLLTNESLLALLEIVGINVVLSGDNAIVIGLAAAGLPAKDRGRVIAVGILAATVLRIIFAVLAESLLEVTGLLVVGGLLLLWVCWKMWRELREGHDAEELAAEEALAGHEVPAGTAHKTFAQAAWQIVVADVSMSLDNVLAVAGAAGEHKTVLIIGLALSIALMGVAASFIARLIGRFRWIAYVGLLIILYVALKMIWDGSHEVAALALA
jgi:YjbE family integral membrane protein